MESEQHVIADIDALINESVTGGERGDMFYDLCPDCRHQWHGLACSVMPCGCKSNVQNGQTTHALDDAGPPDTLDADPLARLQRTLDTLCEYLNDLLGVPQRVLLGENHDPLWTVRHQDDCPPDGECHCGSFVIDGPFEEGWEL